MNEDEVIDHRRPTLVVGADVHGLHGKRYYFAPTACGCLDLENPLRKAVIKVITNHWFDRTILTLILINSVIMALTDFGERPRAHCPPTAQPPHTKQQLTMPPPLAGRRLRAPYREHQR